MINQTKNGISHNRLTLSSLVMVLIAFTVALPVALGQGSSSSPNYRETMVLGRGGIGDVAWSPNGDDIAVASQSGVWIYNDQFEDIAHLNIPTSLIDSNTEVASIAWSPNGSYLAIGIRGINHTTIQVWNSTPHSFTLVTTIEQNFGPAVFPIVWSPDNTKIALNIPSDVINTSRIGIFEVSTGQKIQELDGVNAPLFALAWDPSNAYLAASDESNTVYLFDLATNHLIHTFAASFQSPLAWNPNGNLLAAADGNNNIQIWNIPTFQSGLTLQGHSSEILDLDWGAEGLASSSYDSTVRIWDTTNGQSVQVLPVRSQNINWSPDGNKLITANTNQDIQIWSRIDGTVTATFQKHSGSISTFDWETSASLFITADNSGKIQIWNSTNGDLLKTIKDASNPISCLAFSPDGTKFATGNSDYSVNIWNTSTGEVLQSLQGHQARINALSWNLSGTQLATASGDNKIIIWDTSTGQAIHLFEGHEFGINNIVWSPDASQLAGAGQDGTVRIWDTATGLLHVLDHNSTPVTKIAYNMNGDKLVTGDSIGILRIWDTTSGLLLNTIEAHHNSVNGLTWTISNGMIASAAGSEVKTWDINNGQNVESFGVMGRGIIGLISSADGETLATANQDGTIRVFVK